MTSAECRFCLETDTVENLLSPCLCKGSSKYVHNDCLMCWYNQVPARGLRCNTCLTEYGRENSHSIEKIHYPHVLIMLRINCPLLSILFFHWILTLWFNSTKGVFLLVNTNLFYFFYQILNHLFTFYNLSALIYNVKNKRMYAAMWLTRDRVTLIFLHSYLLATLSETTWIGGMAAEYVTCLYFHTHYTILEEINRNYTFRFLSR